MTRSDGELSDPGQEDLESGPVETAFGDDHVGVAFARLDKALVGGTHSFEVLVDDALHGAPAVGDVAGETAGARRQGRLGFQLAQFFFQMLCTLRQLLAKKCSAWPPR